VYYAVDCDDVEDDNYDDDDHYYSRQDFEARKDIGGKGRGGA